MNIVRVVMRSLLYVLLAIAAVGVFLLWRQDDDGLVASIFTFGIGIAVLIGAMVVLFPFWVIAQMRAHKKNKEGKGN